MTTVTPTIRFECSAGGALTVTAICGEEALSRAFRFTIDLVSSDAALPLDDIIGQSATLHLGDRRIGGVVAELEQGDPCDEGYRYRVVLASQLWLLSLGTRSRVFRDMTLPQIATAVAAAAGVDVQLRLSRAYAVEPFVVQYRESDLSFMSRLLEAEGVAYHLRGDTLVLSDHNGAFDDVVTTAVDRLTCTRKLQPRGLLLHDIDTSEQTPVEAHVGVDARGFGTHIEDDARLLSPELGREVALRRAEAMRARATRYTGRCTSAVAPGQRLALAGHFRADFNRDYVIVGAFHEGDADGVNTVFHAIDATTVYRPELVTPKPRVDGVMRAVIDADVDTRGRYSVALPFDLGGNTGHGSQPLPLVSPDEGVSFTLCKGTTVVLDFVDGDPSRPLIAGAVPRCDKRDPGRSVIRTPQGAIIEMSGAYATKPQGEAHQVDGALAELRPLTGSTAVTATGGNAQVDLSWTAVTNATHYEVWRDGTRITTVTTTTYTDTDVINGTVYSYEIKAIERTHLADTALGSGTASATPHTDLAEAVYGEESAGAADWIRFAVPHGDGKWSYLRYGENVADMVTSSDETAGSFAELGNIEGPFASRYFDSDGESGTGNSFEWSALDDQAYDTNTDGKLNSRGAKSYFNHDNSAGVFDYTDGNRTTITRGDHQSVTQGHRTDVILGDYRLVIPNRTNGVYDADTYWMRYRKVANSWRKTERSHVSSDSITWGDTESLFMGFTVDGFFGTKVDATIGGEVSAFVGYKLDIGAGITAEFDLGHKFDYSYGKCFTKSTKHELEATDRITMRIPGPFERTKEASNRIAAAATMTVLSGGLIAASTGVFAGAEPLGDAKWPIGLTLSGAATAAFIGALASYYCIKDRKAKEDEPSIELVKDSITLSIGTSSITLHKTDGICIETGDDETMMVFNTEEGVQVWSKEGMIVEEGDFHVQTGDFCVTTGKGFVKDKAISVQ